MMLDQMKLCRSKEPLGAVRSIRRLSASRSISARILPARKRTTSDRWPYVAQAMASANKERRRGLVTLAKPKRKRNRTIDALNSIGIVHILESISTGLYTSHDQTFPNRTVARKNLQRLSGSDSIRGGYQFAPNHACEM